MKRVKKWILTLVWNRVSKSMRGLVLACVLWFCPSSTNGQIWQYKLKKPQISNPAFLEDYHETALIYQLDTINPIVQLKLVLQKNGFYKPSGNKIFQDIFGDHLIRINSQEIRYTFSDTTSQSYVFVNGEVSFKKYKKGEERLRQLEKMLPKKLTTAEERELGLLLIHRVHACDDLAKHEHKVPLRYYNYRVRVTEFLAKKNVQWCNQQVEVYTFILHYGADAPHSFYVGFSPKIGILWIGITGLFSTSVFELQCVEDHK